MSYQDTYRQWLEGEFECSLEEAAQEVAAIIRTMGLAVQQ